jgi:hypothetical protein
MKRFLIICAAIVTGVGGIAQAQLTNNPIIVNTTNTTVLVPVVSTGGFPTYGFGVALLGYPMASVGTNFFADRLDGAALSDASTAPESGMLQFYAANEDNQIVAGVLDNYNIVGRRVLQSISNPNNMTVYQSWVATVQTNVDGSSVAPDTGNTGGFEAGSFGLGSVSKKGTIAVRMDGSSCNLGLCMTGEALVILPPQVPSTIIFTNAVSNRYGPVAIPGSGSNQMVLAITTFTGGLPAIGQNSELIAKNNFGFYFYVARTDINPANAGAQSFSSNGYCVVSAAGATEPTVPTASTPTGFFSGQANWGNTRGSIAINDTAKMMAIFIKSTGNTAGTDQTGALAVFKYTDAGGPITPASTFQTNIFGTGYATLNPISGNLGGYNTNAQYYFSRSPFAGPSQISINDSGAVAFAVSINCDNANDPTNGARAAQVTGILYQPANSANFLKVCDNTDTNLFWQSPLTCTNKNFISSPALDNYGNVYFEAAYTSNTNFPCDLFPSNAVYEAVANDPINPTNWTVRILVREGDTFTNQVSGDVFQIRALPYNAGPNTRTTSQRAFSPTGINRTQLPGHTIGNTVPSDPFAVGGILVQATLTNLTRHYGSDGLVYVAPISACQSLPFVITSVARSGSNISVTYNAQPGTNTVESTAGGNYTGSGFTVLTASTNIVTGCAASATFVDVGGGSGNSNNYYRVRNSAP